MKNNDYDEKILVFNPAGFILKMILTIGAIIFQIVNTTQEMIVHDGGIIYTIINYTMNVLLIYFLATLFGFCLRATGNYIIAFILMFILFVLLAVVIDWISAKSQMADLAVSAVCVVGLIWLPINDIKKAILYYKNTV